MKNQRETTLDVEGMTCASCVRHVTTALKGVTGVGQVDVALRQGIVVIRHDATDAPVDRLIEALREAGYESRPKDV